MAESEQTHCRLDQWLMAARFYKTRALAITAIKNHRITVNGGHAKPSRLLAVGDRVAIHKSAEQEYTVNVLALATKRPSAKIAATFYQETEESQQRRAHLLAQQKLARELVHFPERRPDKRDRRLLRDIHRH